MQDVLGLETTHGQVAFGPQAHVLVVHRTSSDALSQEIVVFNLSLVERGKTACIQVRAISESPTL